MVEETSVSGLLWYECLTSDLLGLWGSLEFMDFQVVWDTGGVCLEGWLRFRELLLLVEYGVLTGSLLLIL